MLARMDGDGVSRAEWRSHTVAPGHARRIFRTPLRSPGMARRYKKPVEHGSTLQGERRAGPGVIPQAFSSPSGSCMVMQCRLPFCQISERQGTCTISRPGWAWASTSRARSSAGSP